MAGTVVLFFVRWPEVGRVKTRLAATVGAAAACRIHRFLAERTFYAGVLTPEVRLIVCGTGATPEEFREWLPRAAEYWTQPEGDLGVRLETLFARAFAEQGGPVIAIGSDCGDLRSGNLREAANALGAGAAGLYLMPATDGGYVLIGLGAMEPGVFRDMPWSTEELLPATLERAGAQGLNAELGPVLADVDTEEDWKAFCAAHPEIDASGILRRVD
jgi:rSAM/selenodomain-associated transferase 1